MVAPFCQPPSGQSKLDLQPSVSLLSLVRYGRSSSKSSGKTARTLKEFIKIQDPIQEWTRTTGSELNCQRIFAGFAECQPSLGHGLQSHIQTALTILLKSHQDHKGRRDEISSSPKVKVVENVRAKGVGLAESHGQREAALPMLAFHDGSALKSSNGIEGTPAMQMWQMPGQSICDSPRLGALLKCLSRWAASMRNGQSPFTPTVPRRKMCVSAPICTGTP